METFTWIYNMCGAFNVSLVLIIWWAAIIPVLSLDLDFKADVLLQAFISSGLLKTHVAPTNPLFSHQLIHFPGSWFYFWTSGLTRDTRNPWKQWIVPSCSSNIVSFCSDSQVFNLSLSRCRREKTASIYNLLTLFPRSRCVTDTSFMVNIYLWR